MQTFMHPNVLKLSVQPAEGWSSWVAFERSMKADSVTLDPEPGVVQVLEDEGVHRVANEDGMGRVWVAIRDSTPCLVEYVV